MMTVLRSDLDAANEYKDKLKAKSTKLDKLLKNQRDSGNTKGLGFEHGESSGTINQDDTSGQKNNQENPPINWNQRSSNYVNEGEEDSEKAESDKVEDDMEATEGSKSSKMDTNAPKYETIKDDNKNASPYSNTSPLHISEEDRRKSEGRQTAAKGGEKEEVVHCAGCNSISKDLNRVKKKFDYLASHVNKIGKFTIKVMHSSATSMRLLHQEKMKQGGLEGDTTKELFEFLAQNWTGLLLSQHMGAIKHD
ncbi:uncharacterized protein LOC131875952 [Cryptomeria japonica]|uniref:uncharacterized protein LOC131875952 n=1 Tax=Cryptomeria japonica TaxID=3369 RepID=UPI0027DA9B60|nr:uncharacterized protein LOC131875952 [Cryptomeria japonica]